MHLTCPPFTTAQVEPLPAAIAMALSMPVSNGARRANGEAVDLPPPHSPDEVEAA